MAKKKPAPVIISDDCMDAGGRATHGAVAESPTLFAKRIGKSKSYITKLKQDDRLVTEPSKSGKRWVVLVEASLAKIKETEDPNRKDVAGRHEKNRHTKSEGGKKEETAAPAPTEDREEMSYQKARRKNEEFKAAKQEAEYLLLIGKLVDADVVKLAGADLGTLLRTSLENMQDQLSAELAAETDSARIHTLLGESFEYALKEISRTLQDSFGG